MLLSLNEEMLVRTPHQQKSHSRPLYSQPYHDQGLTVDYSSHTHHNTACTLAKSIRIVYSNSQYSGEWFRVLKQSIPGLVISSGDEAMHLRMRYFWPTVEYASMYLPDTHLGHSIEEFIESGTGGKATRCSSHCITMSRIGHSDSQTGGRHLNQCLQPLNVWQVRTVGDSWAKIKQCNIILPF